MPNDDVLAAPDTALPAGPPTGPSARLCGPAAPTRRTVLAVAGCGIALTACGGSGGSDSASGGGSGAKPKGPAGSTPGSALLALEEVPVGQAKTVRVEGGKSVVVSRTGEAEVRGFSASCTHEGCLVRPDGGELNCPCHGSKFNAATGEVLQGPADDPLPEVPMKIEGGQVVLA